MSFQGQNHPLIGFINLQYLFFVNLHSVSKRIELLTNHLENIICYISTLWKEDEDNEQNAINYLEVECYKGLGIFYNSLSGHLHRQVNQSTDENEKITLTAKHDNAISLAKEYFNIALDKVKNNRQRSIIIQKHMVPLQENQNRTTSSRVLSYQTVAYISAVETYIDGPECQSLLSHLLDLTIGNNYLHISQTDREWFKPIGYRQNTIRSTHHLPAYFSAVSALPSYQETTPPQLAQSNNPELCMCAECCNIRTEIIWFFDNIPSEFQSNDHFYFEVSRVIDVIGRFHSYFNYIDSIGKNMILQIIGRITAYRDYLSPYEICLIDSIALRING